MGYFVGTSSYEILSITENRMRVRVVQANNPFWLGIIFYNDSSAALQIILF
jgi:hypothetical protein